MSSVGLLYVGAVLFINGLMLIGLVPGKSAAILNFFVGTMQVVFPTIILIQADNDLPTIFGAAGLYLFGFTYLYVGLLQMTGISGEGLGWFSLFVAVCAVVIGTLQFTLVGDPVFGVIWWTWAVLWLLFFLLLGLGRESLTYPTGWFTIFVAHLTGTIPAFFLLVGRYETNTSLALLVAVAAAAALGAAFFLGRRGIPRGKTSTRQDVGVSPA
ncbi:AmiS/UreI family transporter [Arthrobacter sp. B0490]|uniref:AmiS/UreI family transporter n=1 Tax=Arthrobacter sp. B0490 TaxID=2058891 RepID=UPI000CE465B4|nr:AmiS/UreI family transporter [Arthrobacter sp. B0490]